MNVIVAVRFGFSEVLVAASEATAAVPVLAAATLAVTGDAAAIPT